MDVKLSIGEEDVGMSNPIKEEVTKDEMDTLKEKEIWRRRRERMNNALAATRTVAGQDPAERHAAARELIGVINRGKVDDFISMMEKLADRVNLSAIFNVSGLRGGSLLDVAVDACKDDFLRLLVDYAPVPHIEAQDDWGDTLLHKAVKNWDYLSVKKLTCLASYLPNVKDKNQILRMKNRHGNTALHEAALEGDASMVHLLLSKDLEPIYLQNAEQKSPLYLALDTCDYDLYEALLPPSLDPSKIQGLPPVHGALVRRDYGLLQWMLRRNMKLFAMTDSEGGNIFHLAAYTNQHRVFRLLGSKTAYLAQQRDKNGDLPIHIASKMGHLEVIKKLYAVSKGPNGQGQTIFHVAAKYGKTSVVRYILSHLESKKLINEKDRSGNTALHLAAMHSQPAALIHLVMDERINPFLLNHECLTAYETAQRSIKEEDTFRKQLAVRVLGLKSAKSKDSLVLRPKARDRDKELSVVQLRKKKPEADYMKDVINTRLLVATLVATVTFTAGFAVPGGFNGSDKASKDDWGMATMLNYRMFQAFVICNTIAMFGSVIAVVNLIWAQTKDVHMAMTAYKHSEFPLTIALPAMCVAFLTGVTLTVSKLSWLAHTIFYLGLVNVLIITGAKSTEFFPITQVRSRLIRLLLCRFALAYIYLWGVQTHLLADPEEDGKSSGTSAGRPPNGAGVLKADDLATAKCGDAPHPFNPSF